MQANLCKTNLGHIADGIIFGMINGVVRIFDWGAKSQITSNDVIKKFQKKDLLMEQRYHRMEDQKPACN